MRRLPGARALVFAILTARAAAAHPPPSERIAELEAHVRTSPGDVPALAQLSELFRDAGMLGHAGARIEAALRLAPDDPAVLLEAALVFAAQRNPARAERSLDRCLAKRPDLAAARALRGEIRRARGDGRGARADLAAAVDAKPTPERVLALSALDEELGEPDRAARDLSDGLARLGGASSLRLAWAELEGRRGDYARAADLLGPLVEASRQRGEFLLRRAELYRLSNREAEALRDLALALSEADERLTRRPSAALHLARARALLALGRRPEAAVAARAALALTPRLEGAKATLSAAEKPGGAAR